MLQKSLKSLLGDKSRFIGIGLVWQVNLIWLIWFAGSCVHTRQPATSEESVAEISQPVLAEPNVDDTTLLIKQVYTAIGKGDFAAAGELLGEKGSVTSESAAIGQLRNIVCEYEVLDKQRQQAKEQAYSEQLAELEKFRNLMAVADVNDVNEANNIPKVLLIVAKAEEFANEQQKQKLLEDQFVKQTIQKAKENATELESKGEWLDSYISSYSYLQAIDKDNKAYSDYCEQLLVKANISASFQDSPCESRNERYENVDKKLFIRAVRALNYSYVGIVDYREMAAKAIERCKLLTEVLGNPYTEKDTKYEVKDNQIEAWLTALAKFKSEVDDSPTGVSMDKFLDTFEKVLELNGRTVKLPEAALITQFAEASLMALDPYTLIIWPKQQEDFERIMTNEFTGIGIEISKEKGLLTVVSLLPDTPAYTSGLDAGDIIETVDGVSTKDMSLGCAVHNITGPEGTDVTLTIKSEGESETHDITITRAKITVPTIRGWQRTETGEWQYMIDEPNKIGYVRITNFSEKTAQDFEEVLKQLEAEGLKGLVLDLRFNSGGLLNSAIEITDKFVKEGAIVITRPRLGFPSYASARVEGTHPDYPLVVLINSGSASASEIVAGALADQKYKRAILVGERTHGKGSVQTVTNYPGDGAQLKYTMAYYHLPSNQRVKSKEEVEKQGKGDWGVGPNVEVKLRSDEIRKMIDVQRDNDVLFKAGHNNGSRPLKKYAAEIIKADPQLEVGILVVRSQLICSEVLNRNLN